MRLVPTATLLGLALLAGPPARAEDFTGFYAGINAGYALGREREARAAAPGAGPTGATGTGPAKTGADLPPSAAQAARQMRAPGRTEAWALPR